MHKINRLRLKASRDCLIVETRRSQTEAPVPGYRGYIPRVRTTEVGLGTRYHEMTKNGLENFYTARYEREKRYGPLPDTFGAQRHEPARIKRFVATETVQGFPPPFLQSANAQNPLHTFPRNFPVEGEAAGLLR